MTVNGAIILFIFFLFKDILEKYYCENPWYDSTNLEELIKYTGLDDHTIKVCIFKCKLLLLATLFFFLFDIEIF